MNVKGTSKSKGRRGNEEDICGTVGRVIIVWQKDQRCDDDQLLSGKWSRNDKQQGECYCMRTNDEYWSSVVLTSSHCTLQGLLVLSRMLAKRKVSVNVFNGFNGGWHGTQH